MRYFCTIYTRECTPASTTTAGGSGGGDGSPLARVSVSGSSKRRAAAQAYVECVGRERARLMRERLVPARLARLQADADAIAASLRKVNRSGSDCYLLDDLAQGWFVHVEPVVDAPRTSPRRLRLPVPLLLHLHRTPSPN